MPSLVNSGSLWAVPAICAGLIILFTLLVAACIWISLQRSVESVREDDPEPLLRYAPFAVLIVGLLCSGVAWQKQYSAEQSAGGQEFQREVDAVQKAIDSRLQKYQLLLTSLSEDSQATNATTQSLRSLFDAQDLDKKYPNIAQLFYVHYLPEAQRAGFLARFKKDDLGEISLDSNRGEYFLIHASEPFRRPSRLIGFDLGTLPDARRALDRSRAESRAELTTKIKLPDDAQPAFLMVYPVYALDKARQTIGERKDACQGWMALRLRPADTFRDLIPKDMPHVQLRVYDGILMDANTLFFDSAKTPKSSTPSVVKTIHIGDHLWTLGFSPFDPEGGLYQNAMPALTAALGVCLTLLCAFLIWVLLQIRRHGYAVATRMVRNLQARDQLFSAMPASMAVTDASEDLFVTYVNARFERLTQYSLKEVVGQNLRFLQADQRDDKACRELKSAIQEGKEAHVVLRNFRKDGSAFWNELTLSPVRDMKGKITNWVGIQYDVTERVLTERRMATQIAITRALAESQTLEASASKVIQAVCESQGWSVGLLWKVDAQGSALRLVDLWSVSDVRVDEFEKVCRDLSLPKDFGLAGYVWTKGEHIVVTEVIKDTRVLHGPLLARLGLTSGVAFPIASRRGTLGVIEFYGKRIQPLDKNLLLTMAGMANQIAWFMEQFQRAENPAPTPTFPEPQILDALGIPIAITDLKGYCVYINPAALALLHAKRGDYYNHNFHDQVHPVGASGEICPKEHCAVLGAILNPQGARRSRQMFIGADGAALPIGCASFPMPDNRGLIFVFSEWHAWSQQSINDGKAVGEATLKVEGQSAAALPSPNDEAIAEEAVVIKPKPIVIYVQEALETPEHVIADLDNDGFTVYTAENPSEAFLLSESHAGNVQALVTNVILSQMRGKDLADQLRQMHPELKTIYVSNHPADTLIDLKILERDVPFIRAPFESSQLSDKLRQVLEMEERL